MCHRQLRFHQFDRCKDVIFVGESKVDCHKADCFNSRLHPQPCSNNLPNGQCGCRRYWTQPERLYKDLDGKCDKCTDEDARNAAAGGSAQ
ncbi:hypothetical protein PsYK624_113250 [Phanerochaete sordida]|uniref:Uncharacterized protein n=1 Tax=Phanerochaete sordida TaxID=48140 RepID=A0A9P3GJ11_9APHY|nr:hypothetical protein PsYK624_113250 [Phanerochaete sordida]